MKIFEASLEGKHLYITDLTKKLMSYELGKKRMNPTAYRLWAKRLNEALAGYPEPLARVNFADNALVLETLDNRQFNQTGKL